VAERSGSWLGLESTKSPATWPISNQTVSGYKGYREIPFDVDFETVHLSFTKAARAHEVDCNSDLQTGEHGLFGTPLKPVSEPAPADTPVDKPPPPPPGG